MPVSLFFNKVADLRPAILLKKDSGTGVFCKNTFSYRVSPMAASDTWALI